MDSWGEYLPEAEYAKAWEHKLLDATMYRAHEDYRRELEQTRQAVTSQPDTPACVVPLDVTGLLTYGEREGKDPASRQTRLDYNNFLDGAGRDIPWPPQRNAPCWCGSARKYKKCCAAPGFLAVEAPDPASLVLKIELDHVEPPVWRRVAVPSNTPLDRVHQMIQTAMGWHDTHLYTFENDAYTIIDPRSDAPGISAEGERLVSIATEQGQRFSYQYDFGDNWWHTVTLEEVREARSREHLPDSRRCRGVSTRRLWWTRRIPSPGAGADRPGRPRPRRRDRMARRGLRPRAVPTAMTIEE